MPSFLFQEQSPAIQPYQHPSELMLKAGMYRDAKFKEGLQNIRSKYDNLLSLQLTNPGNQQFVRNQLKTAVDQLDKYSTADLSLPENVGSVMSLFDPVTDDKGVLNDLAFTQHMSRQKAKIEQLSIDKPDLVAPQNVFPLLQAEQQYRSGDRTATPVYASFQPYHNYEKDDNEFLSKLKEDISADPEVFNIKDPVTGEVVGLRGEREVKEISKQRIMGAMSNSTDPRKLAQMQLDYNYARATGAFDARSAARGITQDLDDWNSKVQNAKQLRDSGNLSVAQIGTLDKQINFANSEIARLNKLRSVIAADPSKATDYYSFDKYANDYIKQKAEEYSYRQEGEFKANEYEKEVFKFGLDQYMENIKSNLRIKEEYVKASLKDSVSGDSDEETGLRPNGSYEYNPPLKSVIDQVAITGNATVDLSNPGLPAMLGNARVEKDGTISYFNAGGGDTDLSKRIFVKEGTDTTTPEEMRTIQVNSIINSMISELEKKYKNEFNPSASRQGIDNLLATDPYATRGLSRPEPERVDKIAVLARKFAEHSSGTAKRTGEGGAIYDKYKRQLNQLGVTSITPDIVANYQKYINSDKGTSHAEIGVLLNKDSKGKYEFVPSGTNNIVGMGDGKLGVSGYFALTEDDVDRLGLPAKKMLRDGVLSRVAPDVVYADVNGKATKTVTDKYWLSVTLPVSGNLEEINNKMFEAGDMQKLQQKEQYPAFIKQSNAFRQYAGVSAYANTQLERTGPNTWAPAANSEINTRIQNALRSADQTKMGKEIRQNYEQLLRQPQTQFDLIRNLNSFVQSVETNLGPENVKLNSDQINVMNMIRSVGKKVNASERDIQVAIATAMTETGLANLNYGDRDSVGIFQQRPSQGWGSVEQLTDPNESIRRFFLGVPEKGIPGLLSIKDRDKKSIQELAQSTQRSAYPDRYGKWARAFNFK